MKTFLMMCMSLLFLASCTSIDVEKNVLDTGSGETQGKTEGGKSMPPVAYIETPPEIVIKERPVYVPESPAPRSVPSSSGKQAVMDSNSAGILKPTDYSRAAMIYDYDPDWVYEVYTQPLRACDIRLEPGEQASELPFISDSDRWMIGAGVSYEQGLAVQHIYIKPKEASLEATLIINTNRRVYHIILRSYRDIHMPMVRWRYPTDGGMPSNFIQPIEKTANGDTPQAQKNEQGTGVNPELLSFNYRITYGIFSKPSWLPELIYDDGKKTYISFPASVLPRSLPAVFENRNDVVNYRVVGRIIIIDKLIEEITVKIEGSEISIQKKRR